MRHALADLIINLSPRRDTRCHACGATCAVEYGLAVDPTGEFVENDYAGEWGGVPACKPCFDVHRALGVAGLKLRLETLAECAIARELASMADQYDAR
ncbi:MAG TPA: hypothetical protein VH539_07030 [Gemmatimonadaceae bacterium]|jgi:hypothetical protein